MHRSTRHPRTTRARARRVVTGLVLALLVLPLFAVPSRGGTTLHVTVDGAGSGRAHTPGIACDEGGEGAYWHHDYRAPVPGGTLNQRPAELQVHLDVHSDLVQFPGLDPAATGQDPPEGPAAFLAGADSRVTFVDHRGTLQLALSSGSCTIPTLGFDGTTVDGEGTWTVRRGTGGYEGATGSGTFDVQADVGPTADEPIGLQLAGPIEVRRPTLEAEVVETFWGGLGADYLTRRPSVVWRVTNAGPGPAYGARVTNAFSDTPGAEAIGPTSAHLGDLDVGQDATLTVRYELGLLTPCDLVLLGCSFEAGIEVVLPDVLDDPVVAEARVDTAAPDLPPPL